MHSLNCSLNLSLLTGMDAIKTFVAVYHLFTYMPPCPFERHMCTCLDQIYLGWFDMRGHKWHWAGRTGPQSQAQLPEPHSRRVYCPQTITSSEAAYGSPWKIVPTRSQASPYSRLKALCLLSFLLKAPSPAPSAGLWHLCANPSPRNTPREEVMVPTWLIPGHSQYSGFGKPVTFLPLYWCLQFPHPSSQPGEQPAVCPSSGWLRMVCSAFSTPHV